MTTRSHADLPQPSADALAVSRQLTERIEQAIDAAGGALPFERYMAMALYEPGLGYYSAGSHKLGAAGDFTTAPELSPLFSRCLAAQVRQCFSLSEGRQLLEFGAGSGAMAIGILNTLGEWGLAPEAYFIVEVSADLRQRQQENIRRQAGQWYERVQWLESPPAEGIHGMILANEVLDALPVALLEWQDDALLQAMVVKQGDGFNIEYRPSEDVELIATANSLRERYQLEPGYRSEICPGMPAWVMTLSDSLQSGGIILSDYGHAGAEFYHPRRSNGTLMCHYRHRAHEDPMLWPGLQDITAHVDFSAVMRAAAQSGLETVGYTTQANFLIGVGMESVIDVDPTDAQAFQSVAAEIRQLTLPTHMGERFKFIGLSRNMPGDWGGFSLRDLQRSLSA